MMKSLINTFIPLNIFKRPCSQQIQSHSQLHSDYIQLRMFWWNKDQTRIWPGSFQEFCVRWGMFEVSKNYWTDPTNRKYQVHSFNHRIRYKGLSLQLRTATQPLLYFPNSDNPELWIILYFMSSTPVFSSRTLSLLCLKNSLNDGSPAYSNDNYWEQRTLQRPQRQGKETYWLLTRSHQSRGELVFKVSPARHYLPRIEINMRPHQRLRRVQQRIKLEICITWTMVSARTVIQPVKILILVLPSQSIQYIQT